MEKISQPHNRLLYLDWLRALAIIGVVAIHTVDPFATFRWEGKLGLVQIMIASLFRFAVPMYVMMSGALLLGKQEPNSEFFRKRLARAIIPLIAWSAIFLTWYSWSYPHFSWYDSIFRLILFGQPFYLIFVLLGLYAITPFLRTYVQAASARELGMATGFCLMLSCLTSLVQEWLIAPHSILPLFTFSYFVFFIGYYLAGYVVRQKAFSPRQAWVWLLVGNVITLGGTIWFEKIFGQGSKGLIWWGYFSPGVMMMTLGLYALIKSYSSKISTWIVASKIMSLLALNSLAIYFIHQIVLEVFFPKLKHFGLLPGVSGAAFGLALLGSLLVAMVLKKVPVLDRVLGI